MSRSFDVCFRSVVFSCVVLGCVVAGCPSDDASPPTEALDTVGGTDLTAPDTDEAQPELPAADVEAPPTGPTWHRDIKPILGTRCVSCHVAGDVAPFALDELEAARTWMAASLLAIETGAMPPWLPDTTCRPVQDERFITPDEVSVLKAWLADDMPEGDAATAPPTVAVPDPDALFEPTHVGRIEPAYLPNDTAPDDYRCFILDLEVNEDLYVVGSRVVPDQRNIVHHVLVYAIEPNLLPSVEAADAEEEGPGYTCFGAPFPGTGGLVDGGVGNLGRIADGDFGLPTTIGAWVPGQVTQMAPPGVGKRIVKGSRIVMQLHYNLLAGEPAEDQTRFEMMVSKEAPETLTFTTPVPNLDISIDADDPVSVQERIFTNYNEMPLTIVGFAAHMHLLGTTFQVDVLNEDGSEDCLVDIPSWDFNWQQFYKLPADAPVVIAPGQSFRLRCTYDNSASNQPVINGEQLTPAAVKWGEGTLEEMCLLYLELAKPFEPPNEIATASCSASQKCMNDCKDDLSLDCLFSCPDTGLRCNACAVLSLFGCGIPCAGAALPMTDCFKSCITQTAVLGGNAGTCFMTECYDAYQTMLECVDPLVKSGTCDAELGSCGLTPPP